MVNESYMVWQIENRISDLQNIPSKSEVDTAILKTYESILVLIKEQPQADRWIINSTPACDGRYLVLQRYVIDDYEEINTALWKNGQWVLEHGDYNWKYNQYDMDRIIIAWMPLPQKTIEFSSLLSI